MSDDNKTIHDRIHDLARSTKAPNAFVAQVRSLFTSKGISLADDSAPYLAALQEAFRRERVIRTSTLNAKRNLTRLQDRFTHLGDNYRRQVSQLSRIRKSLEQQSRLLEDRSERLEKKHKTAVVLYSSDPRAYITKTLKEEVPMVPGPKDVQ